MNKEKNKAKTLEEEIKLLQKLLSSKISKANNDCCIILFRGVCGFSKDEIQQIISNNKLLNWNVLDIKKDHFKSIADLLKKIDKLYELSQKDPLTGLGNRKKLEETLELEIERSFTTKQPLCLCFLDIDDFKNIINNKGHDVGDNVLKDVAKILKACCRKTDMIFRYGGEELIILFPGTPLYQCEVMSNNIKDTIKNYVFIDNENNSFHVTCSIGIACYKGKKSIDYKELIKEANKALQRAKEKGKDMVVAGEIIDIDLKLEEDLKVKPEEKNLLFGKNL